MANISSVKLPDNSEFNFEDVVTKHGGSNDNLLINGWFTVNQRGFTSATASSGLYTVDRWKSLSSSGTIAASSSGLTITRSGTDVYVAQIFEDDIWNKLIGKTVTASALMSDGTIYSGSGVVSSTEHVTFVDEIDISLGANKNSKAFVIGARSTITVRAVKLEIGSVSTLANDFAPNYSTELLKCQRYFVRKQAFSANRILGFAAVGDSSSASFSLALAAPLYLDGTISVSVTGSYYLQVDNVTYPISSISGSNNKVSQQYNFACSGSSFPSGKVALLMNSSSTAYIDIEAEL